MVTARRQLHMEHMQRGEAEIPQPNVEACGRDHDGDSDDPPSDGADEDIDPLAQGWAQSLPEAYKWIESTKIRLSPTHLLRRRIRAELHASGYPTSGVSEELWELTRQRKANMSPVEWAELERISQLSGWIARRNREKAVNQPAINPACPPPSVAQTWGYQWRSDETHGQREMSLKPLTLAGIPMAAAVAVPRVQGAEEGAPATVRDAERRPMAVDALEAFLRRRGAGAQAVAESFAKDCNQVAKNMGTVGKVTYFSKVHCGAMCVAAPAHLVQMHAQLIRRMETACIPQELQASEASGTEMGFLRFPQQIHNQYQLNMKSDRCVVLPQLEFT